MTLTVWSNFSGREGKVTTSVLESVKQKYPWMTVKHVLGKDDEAIVRAINGGTPPDVAISFTPDNSARFCQTKAFQDLNPNLQADNIDKNAMWPQAIFSYTQYNNIQCSLPMLTDAYGLYYNVDLLQKAGFSEPPKTLSELTTMAKKLTEYNADGSIKVAGFFPLFGLYQNTVNTLGHAYAAKWYDSSGKPSLSTDPNWAKLLEWQKSLVDTIGYDKLQKFFGKLGGGDSEWSAQHGFETGKIAMMIDGEWRNAFIAADKAKVNYQTAPFPVDDAQPDLYGAGQVGGTIMGIPKGVKHPAESWLLVRYMTTDTSALTAIGNDFGFDRLFARQVEAICREGDVCIGISTSGRSENVVQGLITARARGCIAAGLLGGDGGRMAVLCDPALIVPSTVTARVQEMHILLGQMLCAALEQALGLV